MDDKLFCFQCEQTANGRACLGECGVCGKTAEVAALQDALTGALVGLARVCETTGARPTVRTWDLLVEGLFTTVTNVSFHPDAIRALLEEVHIERDRLLLDGTAPCEGDADLASLWTAPEDLRSLKALILFGVRGMASYSYHARLLGQRDEALDRVLAQALVAVGADTDQAELLRVIGAVGRDSLACIELLDLANTMAYGEPAPVAIPLRVEAGPFIVVSGHDLRDLALLLEQTEGEDIGVYTHGEMLPAHGYPALNRYPHLKGHLGTAWHAQRREFSGLPAPVLFTSNCLMPPRDRDAGRIFTTGPVAYPGVTHIDSDKDFGPVIAKARELGGWDTARQFAGLNGGAALTTGHSRSALLRSIDKLVEAIQLGAVRRILLVGGCDGRRPECSYYTELVKAAPADTIVLTMGCGKSRFNDLGLGTIAGFPRLMDLGQCNDAYGAVRVLLALAEAFDCEVSDLPLTVFLSWYEQKAVCVLLALLYLGVRGIRLGPTLPAFLSPNVLALLKEAYGLAPITAPELDLSGPAHA